MRKGKTMSDYIDRQALLEKEKYQDDWNMFLNYVTVDDIKSIPSADVLEHARAIKEYCKERTKKPIWCNDCPLYEAFCKNSTPPNMWDLPIGEKGTE